MSFTKEELIERRKFIGASEAAAVCGLSRWKSPLEVWADKTGKIEPEIKDNIPAEVGTELEDYIARRFTKMTGKKVHKVSEGFKHKKYPYIVAHIDRKVEGESAILQCKTCSAYKSKDWEEDEIPLDYIIQEIQEMACSGYNKAYIAVLIGNHDFKIKEITRDLKAENSLISKVSNFWENYVIKDVMPDIITCKDDEVLNKLYPVAKEGIEVILDNSVDAIIDSIDALSVDKKSIDTQINKLKNELKALIKDNEIGITNSNIITWKNIHCDECIVFAKDYRKLSIKNKKEGI